MIRSKLKFTLRRLREKLWIKPIGYVLLAVAAVYLAQLADRLPPSDLVPDISYETLDKLLSVISASMLGVATFAVTSMVSAYASASSTATPRAFVLVLADSLSQTALSSFIAAFIFSIVGTIAVKTQYLDVSGRFVMFLLILATFAWVILTFVRWVDNIARLGRMENTIERIEVATREAFGHWKPWAPLAGVPATGIPSGGVDLHSETLGFIQHVDMASLDDWADRNDAVIYLRSLPGALITARRPLLTVRHSQKDTVLDMSELLDAFVLAPRRSYATDPRFGLVALSEIGSRALSPAVNDPGTAIDIVVRAARILCDWQSRPPEEDREDPTFVRVHVPSLRPQDLLEDAYAAIIRDGVGSVELDIWVQKSLGLLVREGGAAFEEPAAAQARLALDRAERELAFPPDFERVRRAHAFAMAGEDLSWDPTEG